MQRVTGVGFAITDAVHGDRVALVAFLGMVDPLQPWAGVRYPLAASGAASVRLLDLPRKASLRELLESLGLQEAGPGRWTRRPTGDA